MRYLAFGTAVLVAAIIVAADLGLLHAARVIHDIPMGDKIGHFLLFGVFNLAVIVTAGHFRPLTNPARTAALCSLGVMVAAALEEYSQRYLEARMFSLWDLAASLTGILVSGWLAHRLRLDRSGSTSPEPKDRRA